MKERTLDLIGFTALILAFFALVVLLAGCEQGADAQQREETEMITAEAHAQVGMPSMTHFTERRLAKMILEMRDDPELTTLTYFVDMNGQLHFLCNSIGYGLPYSVQFTNPERYMWRSSAGYTLPQPDPNGLFMPGGLSATWVMCLNPDTGEVEPVYSEPALLVSRFRLDQ